MRLRMLFLRITVLLVFLALILRLYALQFGANAARSRASIEETVTRIDYLSPQRGEIFASDGTTLLAASEPMLVVGIKAERLPRPRLERDAVFMRLSSLLPFSDTLTITPTTALRENTALAGDIAAITPILPADIRFGAAYSATIAIPRGQELAALDVARVYSDVVTLNPGAAQVLRDQQLPPYLTVPVATNISREIAIAISENRAVLPGVEVIEGFRRTYPRTADLPSLAHLLGYVGRITAEELARQPAVTEGPRTYLDNDIIGKDGLELYYEDILRGVLGINQIEVDAYQRAVGEPTVLRPMEHGQNVILHLDYDLQRQSEEILRKWLEVADQRRIALSSQPTADGQRIAQYPPITKGVIIAMDVRTGGILSMVSLPAYDNNYFVKSPLTQAEYDEFQRILNDSENAPLLNRSIRSYPPGSTFKQFTAAAALDYGIITPQTQFHDPGRLVISNKYNEDVTNTYPNSNNRAYGMINVSDALMVSSNVFFQIISGGTDFVINFNPDDPTLDGGLGIERLHQMLTEEFRLGQRTGIDLPGEVAGVIPDPAWKREVIRTTIWSVGDTYIASIGQGDVAVSPLQLLRGTVATSNGGLVLRPQLVQSFATLDRSITTTLEPVVEHRIDLTADHWFAIRDGMRRSVQDPTAYNRLANMNNRPAGDVLAAIDRFNLAGKTGTAEYDEKGLRRSHSWFVGFAPFDTPEIAVVALLEGTGDLGDGSGTLALPAVVDVLRAYYGEPVPTINGDLPAQAAEPPPADR